MATLLLLVLTREPPKVFQVSEVRLRPVANQVTDRVLGALQLGKIAEKGYRKREELPCPSQ
jgi:hypothetical protein